jgi:hypothetical protein
MAEPKTELTEDAAWEIALKYHPEWRRAAKRGKLPDQLIGPNDEPFNPRLHLTIHTIVERQLAADAPKGVVAVAQQLEQLGLSQHDIRHEIGRAVASQLWYLLQEKKVFDEARYLTELQAILEAHRQESRA